MDKNELKACPFCNAPALLEELGDHHGAYYNLGCSVRGCLAFHVKYTESPDECSIEEAIAAWNRRAPAAVPMKPQAYAVIMEGRFHSVHRFEQDAKESGFVAAGVNCRFDILPLYHMLAAAPQEGK
jgi:hypothetical protein